MPHRVAQIDLDPRVQGDTVAHFIDTVGEQVNANGATVVRRHLTSEVGVMLRQSLLQFVGIRETVGELSERLLGILAESPSKK